MKNIIRLLLCSILSITMFTACETNHINSHKYLHKKMLVRLTTYSRNEKLSKKHPDKWSKHGISSTGIPLKNMLSVAVDPKVIPYFSFIKLACLDHPVWSVDTGSCVRSRRAALRCGIDCPVIDLFFDRERDAAEFRRKHPLFVEATILN